MANHFSELKMDLSKSKKSAFFLSGITVLSFSITSAILTILIPYWISGDIHAIIANPESLNDPTHLIALTFLLVLLLLILTGIGAFWLYRFFGETYFGKRGAVRWVLFGLTFACLLRGIDWVLNGKLWALEGILQILALFAAYFVTRMLMPLEI
jgi:hypothetical protein